MGNPRQPPEHAADEFREVSFLCVAWLTPKCREDPRGRRGRDAAEGAADQRAGEARLRRLRLVRAGLVEGRRVGAARRDADLLRPEARAAQMFDSLILLFAIR
jgi:hypothetical protein